MATRNQKVHAVIHLAASSAAAVGAGLAQAPGSDAPVLAALQSAMIISIGSLHGAEISESAAADLLLVFAAETGGRALSQWLVGWIPGYGNAINATTAAALTEAIGWAADAYFEQQAVLLTAS